MKYYCIVIIILILSCKKLESEKTSEESNEQLIEETQIVEKEKNLITNKEATQDPPFKNPEEKYFLIQGKDTIVYLKNRFTQKYGLVDSDGAIILDTIYDKIYSPGLIKKGFLEVKKDNRLGLFNLEKRILFKCKYDILFPSKRNNAIAIGKIGSEFYEIKNDGFEVKLEEKDHPSYEEILKNLKFDFLSPDFPKLINNGALDNGEYDLGEGKGVVFTPSYLEKLSFFPEKYENLILDNQNVEFGVGEANLRVGNSKKSRNGIFSFFARFIETGIDTREYQNNKYYLGTIRDKDRVIDVLLGTEYSNTEFYYCTEPFAKFKVINDSLMEYSYMKADKFLNKYDHYIVYQYFKIDSDGNIINLDSKRDFDFTKFVKIEPDYLYGCYGKFREGDYDYDKDPWNLEFTDHLEIEDLDIMRNEIFAEYGYRFKSDKWKNYFSKKSWYNPNYDNVDEFLTPLDKTNLEVILKVKDSLQDLIEPVKKIKIMHGVAG